MFHGISTEEHPASKKNLTLEGAFELKPYFSEN